MLACSHSGFPLAMALGFCRFCCFAEPLVFANMQNICNTHFSCWHWGPMVSREENLLPYQSYSYCRGNLFDMTIRNLVRCDSALMDSELFNSGIVSFPVVPPTVCRFYLAQVIPKLCFSLSTCMFESQLKLDLKSQYFEYASIWGKWNGSAFCFSPYAFSKHLTW